MDVDRTVRGVTELRVHGVSGTPAGQMLHHPEDLVTRVAGDGRSGFFRRWYPGGSTPDEPDRRHLEAYAWGGLTSGPATRALWLLLLPFALVNVAHWMLPVYRGNPRWATVSVTVLRLLGLTLSLALMLATALVTMDIAAWQCGSLPRCAQGFGPLHLTAGWARGSRLAAGSVPPFLLVLLLWWVGRAETRPTQAGAPPRPAVPAGTVPLAVPTFWVADPSTMRLRSAHVAAWLAALGALTQAPVLRFGHGAGQAVARVLLALDLLVLAVCVLAVASNRVTGRGGPSADRATRPLRWLRWFAVVLLSGGLAVLAWAPADYPRPPTHLPVLRGAVIGIIAVQLALLAVLGLSVALQRPWRSAERRPGYGIAVAGFAAPVTALAAWVVAGGLSAGVGLFAAQRLGVAVTDTATAAGQLAETTRILDLPTASFQSKLVAAGADSPLIVPPLAFWAGLAAVGVVAAMLLLALGLALQVRQRTQAWAGPVAAEHPYEREETRARRVARARALAALTDDGVRLVGPLVAIAVLVVVLGLWSYRGGGYQRVQEPPLDRLTQLGVGVIGAAAAGVIGLSFYAFRRPQVRRTIGIIWDVLTFWPRANHPLTPPCYAERAVPDLVARLRTLTADEGDRTVLSGHSQGSVLAAAAVLQLSPAEAGRVGLLTYGSPLRRLYARFFPAYVGTATVDALADRAAPCWRNLWAPSDPIGSWVIRPVASPVDRRLPDPMSLRMDADGVYPPLCGHSGYLTRAEYPVAVSDAARCRTAPS